uniref:Constitutive coactivator of peroxisome proliferator-activated receptor gamma n=1 Tax=Cacopsylla melanoneura TaxID=428564 RepID=A0A8D8Z9N2_9HEMI
MDLKQLEKILETNGSNVFQLVKIEDYRKSNETSYPIKSVELLVDLESCLPYIFPGDMADSKYGGELSTVVVDTIENFYSKFDAIGIQPIIFVGNYKQKFNRHDWTQRQYVAVDKVNKVMNLVRINAKPVPNSGQGMMSAELVHSVISFCRLNDWTIVQSLTDTKTEMITYARKHNTFGILGDDIDFCIANAARNYFSIEQLCLETMTTRLYDAPSLAKHLQLDVNQLPLFATLMGNDRMEKEIIKTFHDDILKKGSGGAFVKNIASLCKPVTCNAKGEPLDNIQVMNLSKQITQGSLSCPTKVSNLIMDSIASYEKYYVGEEFLTNRLDITPEKRDMINLALTLYRQCWITSDLLQLLFVREMQMDTCMEMFNKDGIKPIGDVLARLRKVLYGAAFNSDQNTVISEYVITSDKCLDKGVPTVTPAKLDSVQKLYDVWKTYFIPDNYGHTVCKAWESLTEFVLMDNRKLFYKASTQKMTYFVTLFAQSCDLKPCVVEKLIASLPDLPPKVLVPIFAFLYLDHEPGAFLSTMERHSVLFTFSLVSLLDSNQVKKFLNLNKKAESVELIRATNLFMKTSQLIVNLNALCGFSLGSNSTTHNLLNDLNCHNNWQGSIAQQFYHYFSEGNKQPLDLFNSLCSILKHTVNSGFFPRRQSSFSHESILYKFVNMMNCWTQLELFDELMTKAVQDMLKTVSTDPDHKYKR